jgi:DNA (cytosine-5)-methyltransferase 1
MIPVRLLDLYAGAGGAAMGYAKAGFVVTGVDHKPHHRYPFRFIQADVLDFLDSHDIGRFDAIHASPPCQRFSRGARQHGTAENHPDLVEPTRARLRGTGKPYVIENVEEAPLIQPTMLCGTMFGIGVFRHRMFETNWPLRALAHSAHDGRIGDGRYYTVTGHTGYNSTRDGRFGGSVHDWRRAMDIGWMTARELAESIPPVYTHYIGLQLMAQIRRPTPSRTRGVTA